MTTSLRDSRQLKNRWCPADYDDLRAPRVVVAGHLLVELDERIRDGHGVTGTAIVLAHNAVQIAERCGRDEGPPAQAPQCCALASGRPLD
ncbi:MAG: hypothetical protein ACJ8R9_25535 [Steroidobacteraceae bacterium]